MEKETKFVSLFDYLGHAAGGDLGRAVYAAAKKSRQPTQQRDVSNKKYVGKVLLYTESFLDEYFNKSTTNYSSTLQDDGLPF
jgi:hypothetical protein